MKNIWSAIANKTVVDKDSNMISIFDCIEQFNINIDKKKTDKNEVKKIPAKFEIVSFWKDDEIKKERCGEFAIELYDPNNKKLNKYENSFVMPKAMKRMRTIITFEGFPITTEGEYLFKIKYRKDKKGKYTQVSELPIEVIFDAKNIKNAR
ncbi:hypothetical protein KAI56_02795 [Candidatus Parcubacteria bacterium]|nr:hypothetical protein [Candidatus Parcubacteria bacterium]